jgi:hypothetical protein
MYSITPAFYITNKVLMSFCDWRIETYAFISNVTGM